MDIKEANLFRGAGETEIDTKEFKGTFVSPWALFLRTGNHITYEISLLQSGQFGSPGTMKRDTGKFKDYYDLLMTEKRDWEADPKGRNVPINQQEADELRNFLRDIKAGTFPVTDEFDQCVHPEYLNEVADFIIPRIHHVPCAYIEGTVFARAKTIEDKLKEPGDLPPLPLA